jgi:hypothetical protein
MSPDMPGSGWGPPSPHSPFSGMGSAKGSHRMVRCCGLIHFLRPPQASGPTGRDNPALAVNGTANNIFHLVLPCLALICLVLPCFPQALPSFSTLQRFNASTLQRFNAFNVSTPFRRPSARPMSKTDRRDYPSGVDLRKQAGPGCSWTRRRVRESPHDRHYTTTGPKRSLLGNIK